MTPPDPASNDGPAERIVAGLFKLALVQRHESWRASGGRGLTPTQSQILALLANPREDGGVSGLAERLSLTKGTVSEAVSALERKGLVRKTPSPHDARARVVALTATGRREAVRAARWPEVLVQAVDGLPAREQAAFLRGLSGMIRALQERGAVPLARMCAGCRFFRPNAHLGQAKAHHCDYLDTAISDVDLRLDCNEMEPAEEELRPLLLEALLTGSTLDDAGGLTWSQEP
jgi:DNA-binding MarR family transcriptional regulator